MFTEVVFITTDICIKGWIVEFEEHIARDLCSLNCSNSKRLSDITKSNHGKYVVLDIFAKDI